MKCIQNRTTSLGIQKIGLELGNVCSKFQNNGGEYGMSGALGAFLHLFFELLLAHQALQPFL